MQYLVSFTSCANSIAVVVDTRERYTKEFTAQQAILKTTFVALEYCKSLKLTPDWTVSANEIESTEAIQRFAQSVMQRENKLLELPERYNSY